MVKTPSSSSSAARGNSPPPSRPNTEVKYKGVRKRKWGKYVSEIRLPNSRERIWLGSYDTAEKAARAFDAALFCLRGRCAKFNFPGDAPDIPGGEELGPAEIQTVAQRYANSFCGGGSGSGSGSQNASQLAPPPQDEASPSSEFEDGDSIDWSFLDTLGTDGGNGVDNAGRVSDFGLFTDPYDMYMMQNFAAKNHDDDEDDDVNDPGNVPYSLWNF